LLGGGATVYSAVAWGRNPTITSSNCFWGDRLNLWLLNLGHLNFWQRHRGPSHTPQNRG
jgi:hypothetical protein